MTSRPTSSDHEISSLTCEADKSKEEAMMVVNNFVTMMDSYTGWSPHELHEDAVMDWFGCCLRGRSSILYFLRSHVPKTRHVIERVSKIPPISHRLIKNSKRSGTSSNERSQESSKTLTEECGQGDCKGLSTPANSVLLNVTEMVKAPCVKRPSRSSINWEQCEFVEIRAKVEFENGQSLETTTGKKLERIVLAYTDQINLVIYEAKNNCRKKLFS